MGARYSASELEQIENWLMSGLSAAKIATRLTALRGRPASRAAIIGIVHRTARLRAIGLARSKGWCGGRSGGRLGNSAPEPSSTADQAESAPKAEPRCRPARLSARLAPPAWQPGPTRITGSDGAPLEMPAPRPIAAGGRQPHFVAMRFIDCLFERCRAPLDTTPQEDAENDAPGSRPGLDMLCCGLRTKPSKSYCAYHAARFLRTLPAEAI
ncbi:high mobility group family protein [Mesorhizobium sp. M0663]|uniref:high mobility group family protein n=1 Tax=unclassified Mesorhizobium TaxID=325217 RepID=UPI00333D08FF